MLTIFLMPKKVMTPSKAVATGEDIAIYKGKQNEYVIKNKDQEQGWIEIVDKVDQRDGVDKLFEIEKFSLLIGK